MKTALRDIGLDLIPETTAEKETLERLFKGGANAMGYGTSGRLTISFADLIEKKDCGCDKTTAALKSARQNLDYILDNHKCGECGSYDIKVDIRNNIKQIDDILKVTPPIEENERLRRENTKIFTDITLARQIRLLERLIALEMMQKGISHAQWVRLDKIAIIIQDIIKGGKLDKIQFCPGCDNMVEQCTGQYEDCVNISAAHEAFINKTNRRYNCAICGHSIQRIGTKWQHIDQAPIEYSESPINKGQPNAEIKYRELCYYCPCTTPTPPE